MMNITYGVTEEVYTLGTVSRTSYGIVAYANCDEDDTTTIVASVHDITDDKQSLAELALLCNRLELSAVHLMSVVEDFFTGR